MNVQVNPNNVRMWFLYDVCIFSCHVPSAWIPENCRSCCALAVLVACRALSQESSQPAWWAFWENRAGAEGRDSHLDVLWWQHGRNNGGKHVGNWKHLKTILNLDMFRSLKCFSMVHVRPVGLAFCQVPYCFCGPWLVRGQDKARIS